MKQKDNACVEHRHNIYAAGINTLQYLNEALLSKNISKHEVKS